jgi:hypothetical protein
LFHGQLEGLADLRRVRPTTGNSRAGQLQAFELAADEGGSRRSFMRADVANSGRSNVRTRSDTERRREHDGHQRIGMG